ncbi:hypothetical protein [Brevibacillus porteri]|uniref:hypothetical protein n=1 Tax=Brevibacillus porteri TaxID=2126350 RepID=UPI003D1B3F8F
MNVEKNKPARAWKPWRVLVSIAFLQAIAGSDGHVPDQWGLHDRTKKEAPPYQGEASYFCVS